MKQLFFYLLLFATPLLTQCDDDDHAAETLPEATQTGRGIFACLVDGKPFIDKSGSPNAISFNAYYQFVDGEYYFNVTSSINNNVVNELKTVKIATNQKTVSQGQTIQLLIDEPNNGWGGGALIINSTNSEFIETNLTYTGSLTITKFDLNNQIVSGTFWMDLKNPFTGATIKIREGRFDTRFGI